MESEFATKLWVASIIQEIQLLIETKFVSHQDRLTVRLEQVEENMKNEVKELGMKLRKVADIEHELSDSATELENIAHRVTAVSENDMRLQVDVENIRKTGIESSKEIRLGFDKYVSDLDAWKKSVSLQLRAFEDRIIEISERTAHADSHEVAPVISHTPVHNDEPLAPDVEPNKDPWMRQPELQKSHTSIVDPKQVFEISNKESQNYMLHEFYTLGDSVYEYSLFTFCRMTPLGNSIAILFGVITSVAIQMTLLWLMFKIQIADHVDEREEAWRWRLEHAHHRQYLFDGQHVSLARALCDSRSMPFASREQELMYDIEVYEEQILGIFVPQGLSMAMAVLVIWICDIAFEIIDSVRMAIALLSLPIIPGARFEWIYTSDGRFSLSAMSTLRKLWAMVLCLIRFGSASFLCTTGCLWIARTVNVEEMLFNAVSLSFIVQIDELIADLIVQRGLKRFVRDLAPLRGPSWFTNSPCCQNFLFPGLAIGFSTAVWLFYTAAYVFPNFDDLHEIYHLLCGGVKDFVVQRNETSGLVQIEATSEDHPYFDTELLAAVRLRVGLTPPQ